MDEWEKLRVRLGRDTTPFDSRVTHSHIETREDKRDFFRQLMLQISYVHLFITGKYSEDMMFCLIYLLLVCISYIHGVPLESSGGESTSAHFPVRFGRN